MGADSKIEWTHHTFNLWRGCSEVSPGCDGCYARVLSKRNPSVLGEWGDDGNRVVASEAYWKLPLKWDLAAAAAGERRRVFALSLGDFAEDRKDLPPQRMRLFQLIGQCHNLDFLLLTKRPGVCVENWPGWAGFWVSSRAGSDPGAFERLLDNFVIPNVWLGVSVEDQQRADERIPLLLQTPAAVRFLSIEPLLGPVNLTKWLPAGRANWQCQQCGGFYRFRGDCPHCHAGEVYATGSHVANKRLSTKRLCGSVNRQPIDWVIVGGESGHGARPMHPEWVRSIRDQCQAAGVPFFFKQWGEWKYGSVPGKAGICFYSDGRVVDSTHQAMLDEERSTGKDHNRFAPTWMTLVGKKYSGRSLDDREWSQLPEPRR
jgi:protein gp37